MAGRRPPWGRGPSGKSAVAGLRRGRGHRGQLPDPGVAGLCRGHCAQRLSSGHVSGPSGTPGREEGTDRGDAVVTVPHGSTAPPPNHSGNLATRSSGRCVERLQADGCWLSSREGAGQAGWGRAHGLHRAGAGGPAKGHAKEAVSEETGDWTAHLLGEKPRHPERALTPPRF